MFYENGPLNVTKGTAGVDDYKIFPKRSWADDYNIAYLDQPAGTGFSYPATLDINMDVASNEFVEFMLQLYLKYPEFSNKDLFIVAQSYGGKYGPAHAWRTIQHNNK